ncbi:TPA: hypothetical protein LSW83_004083 [Serratia marcescens]|nr:hypothetical protein [Serratia marcescens]
MNEKQHGYSVYLDGDLALELNRLREQVRKNNAAAGVPGMAPTLGWLARELLREKLGLKESKAAKQDNFTQL